MVIKGKVQKKFSEELDKTEKMINNLNNRRIAEGDPSCLLAIAEQIVVKGIHQNHDLGVQQAKLSSVQTVDEFAENIEQKSEQYILLLESIFSLITTKQFDANCSSFKILSLSESKFESKGIFNF